MASRKAGRKSITLSPSSNFHTTKRAVFLQQPSRQWGNESPSKRKLKPRPPVLFQLLCKALVPNPWQARPYLPATASGCLPDSEGLSKSQVLWQILIGESFQIFANCIKYPYNLLGSPIFILSEAKIWRTKEQHLWPRGRHTQTPVGEGNPPHWAHWPPGATCPSPLHPRLPVRLLPAVPHTPKILNGAQDVQCWLVNTVN